MSIYSFTNRKANGQEVNLGSYEGKVLLIANTASECGLTPQYKELQELHEKYGDQGLVVLGFPCNQFGGQEPGTSAEAEAFCSINYGVTFPIFEKVDVKGEDADPLFRYLTEQTGGEITWNFAKFLVDRQGRVVKLIEPPVKPLEIAPDIEKLLAE
ncbi:glutathione peroxidase [Cohnella endophytica]|uniref:Glutathione peroxidase n=1 Tax=Cohnella endophytica TaxID=2419778 RepID=A0A494Y8Y5_9BACL|nr:glutathione peroxidase [Cohnella endophytica]RKP57123.1 glutathione peroxidase [Cohnella endophytica]